MNKYDEEYSGKSRSQKKRESTAAQKLGESLALLPVAVLKTLELPAPLVEAIIDWKEFPGNEAKRRQMQFIGRLMREMDLGELQEKLDAHLMSNIAVNRAFHEVEKIRGTLVSLDGAALEAYLKDMGKKIPEAPVARLRHLIVTARDEKIYKRPPKAYRELFRLLRKLLVREI